MLNNLQTMLHRYLVAVLALVLCTGWVGSDGTDAHPIGSLPNAHGSVNYAIQVAGALAVSEVRVEDSAKAELVWRFVSSAADPEETTYLVSSTTAGVQIGYGQGSSLPDRYLSTELHYRCADTGLIRVELKIEVGNARTRLAWPVFCTGQRLYLSSPVLGSASIGEQANSSIVWHYENFGEDVEELTYSVESAVDGIEIEPSSGQATPNSSVTTSIAFGCSEVDTSSFELTISVGTASMPVMWDVLCTEESVAVEIPPTLAVASIGEQARATLTWQVRSSNEDAAEVAYTISSSVGGVEISDASGNASPGNSLSHDLGYACAVAESVQADITIQAGDAQQNLIWPIECSAEEIQIVNPPRTVGISLGETVSVGLGWKLVSSRADSRTFDYSVQTTTADLQIGDASGVVVTDTKVSHELTFTCEHEGQFDHPITVRAGLITADATWVVNCVEGSISIVSSPPPESLRVGKSVTTELSWEFLSSQNDTEVEFRISTTTNGVQMRNHYGDVAAGESKDTKLRYACSSRRYVTVDIHLQVGDLTRTVYWPIECFGEDLTRFTARFYQGPLIATVDFEESEGVWTYQEVGEDEETPRQGLPFRTNRQVIVELLTKHDEREPLPFAVQMKSEDQAVALTQIGEVKLATLPEDSDSRFESQFVFELGEGDFQELGLLELLIDPESVYPEINEENNRATFEFDAENSLELPKLKLVIVPIKTQEGTPDVSDVTRFTQPIYELMPVGSLDVSIRSVFDLSEWSWSLDSGQGMLAELYEWFLDEGDRDTFYQGVAIQPAEVTLCGVAYVDSNVAITADESGTCSNHTIAHEIGHNFSLKHAPACGAEKSDPDLDFPYEQGNIGKETGWLLQQRQFIGPTVPVFVDFDHRYYDVMSYCPETFTSEYSYRGALNNLRSRFAVVAAVPAVDPRAVAMEAVADRSVVVVGRVSAEAGWEIRNVRWVDREPHVFNPTASVFVLRIVEVASGIVLHREGLRTLEVAHASNDQLTWGARLPFFDVVGQQLQVLDQNGRVLLDAMLDSYAVEAEESN